MPMPTIATRGSLTALLAGLACPTLTAAQTPTLDDALAARHDVWGDAARNSPGGPSYEFFAGLLPPLRYVNAAFRHYPIPLSAPFGQVKARLISDGSALNARADLDTWREIGFPVTFAAGDEREPFGSDAGRRDGPRYVEGWLPIVTTGHRKGDALYEHEVFASVDPELAAHGVVFVAFTRRGADRGAVHVTLGDDGRAHVWPDARWRWDADDGRLTASLAEGDTARLAVASDRTWLPPRAPLTEDEHVRQRQRTIDEWRALVGGMQVEIPEPIVQDAWRALLVGTLVLARGEAMNYSAGNLYERMFAEESSAAVLALAQWGLDATASRLIPAVLDYDRGDSLAFHNAAFGLQLLARYYRLTGDAAFVQAQRERWQPLIEAIVARRDAELGLLPKEAYCGDIATKVHSTNVNANAWRGLRDVAAVLTDLDDADAPRLTAIAAEFRTAILAAVERSVVRGSEPPFVPIALFGAEAPVSPLTATKQGSYWILMSNYLLRSGVFRGRPESLWITDYLHAHGGVCMGMLRFDQHSGLFANTRGIDDLYTLGYVLDRLEHDDPDRVLVTFYGKLAQGLTRDTFLGAEGTGLVPLDEHGRAMYLPPNAASNALFLWTLRGMLVQDVDADDDGRPDTLRLLHATPRRWLRDGAVLRLLLPTGLGAVAVETRSHLRAGEVLVKLTLPAAASVHLRLRLPDGFTIASAVTGETALPLHGDTIDLTGHCGNLALRCAVRAP